MLVDDDKPIPCLNEAEWQACDDPERMLYFLCYHWRQHLPRWLQLAPTSNRKLRLFACACAAIDPAPDDDTVSAIALAERYADGMATWAELKAAGLAYRGLRCVDRPPALLPYAYDAAYHSVLHRPRDAVLRLARDIFGNPYKTIRVDRSWRAPEALSLVGTIYQERAFDRLPELAVLLEKTGCTHAGVLAHCREANPHVRGCWVLDLLLGLR